MVILRHLTVSVGGTTGIPTTSSFTTANEFQIEIEKVIHDEFTGWSLGVLETLDNVNPTSTGQDWTSHY